MRAKMAENDLGGHEGIYPLSCPLFPVLPLLIIDMQEDTIAIVIL